MKNLNLLNKKIVRSGDASCLEVSPRSCDLNQSAKPSSFFLSNLRDQFFLRESIYVMYFGFLFIFGGIANAHPIDLSAIAQIESSNNPQAFNKHSGARGLFQITPICLKHFNEVHSTSYTVQDLFNPELNREIADWYFNWIYSKTKSVRKTLIGYNWGYSHRNKTALPKETENYLKRYQKLSGVTL